MNELTDSEYATLKRIAAAQLEYERNAEKEKAIKIDKLYKNIFDKNFRDAKDFGRYFFSSNDPYWHVEKYFSMYFVNKYIDRLPIVSKKILKAIKKISEIIYRNNLTEVFK